MKSKTIETNASSKQISTPFSVEFANPIFHRLTSENISSLPISLLNLNQEQISLLPGRATLIHLKVKDVASKDPMSDTVSLQNLRSIILIIIILNLAQI